MPKKRAEEAEAIQEVAKKEEALGLSSDVRGFLSSIAEPSRYPTVAELEDVVDEWGRRGARVETLGQSRAGRPIRAASIGEGPKGLLAWGFPHPDEALGAMALRELGEALLDGRLHLPEWTVHLILVADPDEASRNLWLGSKPSARQFLRGCWRPVHRGLEVDYGFPLEWGPFANSPYFLGRCRSREECRRNCGGGPCLRRHLPFAPLPESRALAAALDRYRPTLVASMHNAGLGGDYTFLLEKEARDTLEAILAAPNAFGQPRHLGEPLDRGRRWLRDAPDLIREPRLSETVRWLESQPAFDPQLLYEDSHSAGNYIEVNLPGAQFICPEVCQYRHPDFGDTSPTDLEEEITISVEERPSGRYEVTRVEVDGRWVVAEQRRTDAPLRRPRRRRVPATRAMLGVRAVLRRRSVLDAADGLWRRVLELESAGLALSEHPYYDERWAQATPGRAQDGGALRIFLTAERYHRPATRAQAASFRLGWPFHTAAVLGNFQNFLAAQDLSNPDLKAVKTALDALQDREIKELPRSVLTPRQAPALRSQLARLLRLVD